jgi:hypothetical protein
MPASALPKHWRISGPLATPSASGGTALDPLAGALGLERGAERLAFTVNGVKVEASVDARHVTVSVTRATKSRRPKITLTRETMLDRDEKRQGLLREVQLGDEKFDSLVFVESSADDAVVEQALSRGAARLAARRVISAGATDVVLEGASVDVRLPLRDGVELETLLEAVDGALELSRAGSGGAPTARAWAGTELKAFSIALLVAAAAAFWFATSAWGTSPLLPLLGIVLGGGVGFIVGKQLEARIDSSTTNGTVVLLALALDGGLFGGAALALINGQGTEVVARLEGVVLDDSRPISGKSGEQPVQVRWSDGEVSWERPAHRVRKGDRVSRVVRKGLLGVEWHDQDF